MKLAFISRVNLDLMLQSNTEVEVECVDTAAIAQEILPPAWIQISIKLGIKFLEVELLETIGMYG